MHFGFVQNGGTLIGFRNSLRWLNTNKFIKLDFKKSKAETKNVTFDQLKIVIQQLPQGCRAVFVLFALEDYKHHEIAKQLGISEGTSKSQYSRAKSILVEKVIRQNQQRYGAGEF